VAVFVTAGQETSMQGDTRKNRREQIYLEEIDGRFMIESNIGIFPAAEVLNVSISGAGLMLDRPLEINTPVKLTFSVADWNITVDGTVVWNKSDWTGENKDLLNYKTGVRFKNHNLRNNVLFFQASQSVMNLVH
jgi:hypothetical protein